jgi:hypothetical protein
MINKEIIDMPRKTLALISGLVLVTVILFAVALRASKTSNNPTPTPSPMNEQTQMQVSPTVSMAHSVLTLSPNPINVAPGGQGQVTVNIDTSDNSVTAVQLELAYDPNSITNVKVVSGSLFQNPVVLIDKNNTQTGRYTYAFGITPNHPTIQGTGTVATVTFTAKATSGTSQLALLPTSLVTARGITASVLKSASGTIVSIGSAQQGQTMQQNPAMMQHTTTGY